MLGLFCVCSPITMLDLSNYKRSQVIIILDEFDSCINLEYINLNNLDKNNLIYYDFMY